MEIKTKREQRTAAVRVRTPVEGLKEVLGQGYGEIMGVLGSQGVQPVGPPFAVYYNMDMKDLDVELGFPVAAEFTENGNVKRGSLPGGRTAVGMHKGPYDTVGDTYNAITAFMSEHKVEPKGLCYESYLNDMNSTKPEDLLTEISFPLKD